MTFRCSTCNKNYKSYQSLWKHNYTFHKNNNFQIIEHQTDVNYKSYICSFCSKNYTRSDNLKRHQLTCLHKNQNEKEVCQDQIKKLIQRIENLEKNQSNQQIINNTSVNNIHVNNTIINVCNIGEENIELLTRDERDYIEKEGLNSVIALVDKLNFNLRLPQHHNFYTSAINDKYANTIDKNTNTIIKQPKKDLFDKLLYSHMKKLKIYTENNSKFSEYYDRLKNFIYHKGKKEFYTQINTLSSNKQNMIIDTLNKIISDQTIKQEDIPIKIETEINYIVNIPEDNYYISDSD
jgi:hypothetical protein